MTILTGDEAAVDKPKHDGALTELGGYRHVGSEAGGYELLSDGTGAKSGVQPFADAFVDRVGCAGFGG